ncbi:MAG: gliding motility-associated C-terminal domain-containing protein, partial [Bacteroidia bacterium]
PSPTHEYPNLVSSNYTATLIVQNANGCLDTVAKPIYIGPAFSFFIPNAFTPNGDGINDYFFGNGIGIEKYDLWILDRWGNMIFHGNDLDDKWDGKSNGGNESSQIDVFIWKVQLVDVFNKTHNFLGTVTLAR